MNNSHAEIRIGVIGCGEYGRVHLHTYRQLERTRRVRLVAVAARTTRTIQGIEKEFSVCGYTDYREMLDAEKLDAVAVVTPDHLHREVVLAVAEKGLHILVEKPMDLSVEGCLSMIEAARRKGILLQVDFHKRFDPHLVAIKSAITEGQIGRLQYGYACMEYPLVTSIPNMVGWVEKTSPSWLLGIHMYDLLNWLCGEDPIRVYATAVSRKLRNRGLSVCDSIQAKIEYSGGCSFSVDTCWILPEKYESGVNQEMRLIGDDGIVEVDLQDRGLRVASKLNPSSVINPDYLLARTTAWGEGYSGYAIESVADFIANVESIRSGGTSDEMVGTYASGVDGLKATSVAEAVDRSIERHEPVGIDRSW